MSEFIYIIDKIIGAEFIRVFEEESARLGPFDYLAQGTLYPDVIESAGTQLDPNTGERVAVKIKSHHRIPNTLKAHREL